LKNRDNKDRYAEIEEDGIHYVILKAGNGQEIARSCPSKEKIGLLGFLPLIGAGALGLGGMAAAAAAIPEINVETPKVEPLAYAEPEVAGAAGGLPKWLLPLLALLLLGALLWWLLKGCKSETPTAAVETPAMVDTAKVETAVTPAPVGEQMDGFAPVILYFDNDEPNKNSQATTTGSNYTQTFERYEARKGKFESEADSPEQKTSIAGFFDNNVKKGMDDLNSLAAMIVKNLDAGEKVNITVKGFASPLAKNDYNINLTKRRISSIRNFLSKYDDGKLSKMMDKISITEQPNGEDSSAAGLSDDEKNTKLSIYDLGPSKERRVEIMDVRFIKE
jgi:outer membrane protein OmpA-like peptidoglycan-associated protein